MTPPAPYDHGGAGVPPARAGETPAPHGSRPVDILMVAIGGYGYYYLQTLLEQVPPGRARLAGVVDPEARRSPAWPWVERLGVPVHDEVAGFYAAGHRADLAVIVSPIHFHVDQSCAALEHGTFVLCDKPLGATIQEARRLVAARDHAERWVMIGYQWSFSTAIQSLKRDILAGLFGRPTRFSTLCCWPRDLAYYQRNTWAGCLRDPATGRWVLDSPANNAMAHHLHNLLFLAGPDQSSSARPAAVEAELYRAYAIESADTVSCRLRTNERLEILCHASHATTRRIDPVFRLEFEEALVTFEGETPAIVACSSTGQRKEYGAPDDTPQFKKLFDAIEAVGNPAATIPCGPEAASAQTLAVNGMHESAGEALGFPAALVEDRGDRRSVPDLADTLERCYRGAVLPSETGAPWARRGETVHLDDYSGYPAAKGAAARIR